MSTFPKPAFYRMTIREFLRHAFIGKPPTPYKIKAAIEAKEWAGEKIGSAYFIFVDEHAQPIRPQSPTGNLGSDALLKEWSHSR